MKTLSRSKPKARVKHKCDFCDEIISVGEIYERSTNIYDNEIYTWKSHITCMKIADKLDMFDDCDEGVTSSDFREYIDQYYYDEHPERELKKTFKERLDFLTLKLISNLP